MSNPKNTDMKWWQTDVIYQIYPRSFQDTTGNGIGDLNGIRQRLDYIRWLGIDAIWISPMYPSPMHDFGYDVSNYVDVHPMFGSLADMDALIAEAHERDIKVILDFVPNHSSDEHEWFIESRSSRDNPKRDWYVWRDPAPDGGPPNNWISCFGGKSAWEFDEATGQYYLHLFVKQQPDLNWRNPEVVEAMRDSLRFWLDRGVDGFRVDVAAGMMKDPEWRDADLNPDWHEGLDPFERLNTHRFFDHPDVHIANKWLRQVSDEYADRVLIGEIYVPIPRMPTYYGNGQDEYHLAFNFHMIESAWDVPTVTAIVNEYEGVMPPYAWPNYALGNHDRTRVATRTGSEQARVAMMLLLTLRGTPTLYYGDEIGMENVDIPLEKEVDPWGLLAPGLGLGRDPVRTPMQWDAGQNAGFSSAEFPWLPIADDHQIANVAVQKTDSSSMLNLTRALLQLRQKTPALNRGAYAYYADTPEEIFGFWRSFGQDRWLVLLNLTGNSAECAIPSASAAQVVMRTHDGGNAIANSAILLRPNEGLIIHHC